MTTAESDEEYRSPVSTLPELAKLPAINRLADALVSRGLHHHAARTIAYAVCDPSTARRQLEQPAEVRVTGGTLEVLHTRVWDPAVPREPADAPRSVVRRGRAHRPASTLEASKGRRRPGLARADHGSRVDG